MNGRHLATRLRQLGLIMVVICAATLSTQVAKVGAQTTNCPGAPASRLTVGSEVHVTPGAANNLRDKPTKTGSILTAVPGDAYVYVLEGPQCTDNLAWWKVYYDQIGWMAEGSGTDYFVEPAASQTVWFKVDTGNVLISYHTISFSYQGSFGKYVVARTHPAAQGDPESPVDATAPEYIEFFFLDQQIDIPDDVNWDGFLVYPAKAFEAMNRDAKTELPELKELVKSKPKTIDTNIPFQPTQYAAQVFHSNVAYPEFKTGSGIRFLTKWTQGMEWIVNEGLRYAFEGFTKDEAYFVSTVFPIRTHLLADSGTDDADFAAIDFSASDDGAAQVRAYIAKITAKLNSAKSSDFDPPLDVIDGIIRSLSIITVE